MAAVGASLRRRELRRKIALAVRTKISSKVRIGIDLLTGLPVLKAGAKAPKLTSRQVAKLLGRFP